MKTSAAKKIKIETDPELLPLLPKYFANRLKDLSALKEALERKDLEFIQKTSHTIRGHGASYGFIKLSEICKKLEIAAEAGNPVDVGKLILQFEEYLNSVELPS